MSDMERVIEAERERIRSEKSSRRFNKVRRALGGTVITGLAAIALAVSLRGGSGEYDQTTKDSLKASLRPTAVKIARGIIKLSTDGDRHKEGNKMTYWITDAVPSVDAKRYPYTSIDIDLVTGITNGRPDPRKVESLSLGRGGHFGQDRTVYIDSPHSNNLPDSFFTGGQAYSGHGAWSGSVIDFRGQRYTTGRGFQINTENAFVASRYIGISEPELDARTQTAETVADMAENTYDLWADSAAQQPR